MASKFVQEFKLPAFEELLGASEVDGEGELGGKAAANGSAAVATSGWAAVAAASAAAEPRAAPRAADRKQRDWHEIPEAKMTPELRRDLVLLENRAHLDPKRFYKSTGTGRKRGELPRRVHVGVVVEAAHEYLSGRLTNKERKKSFADEIFGDARLMDSAKRRFGKLQDARRGNKRVVDPASRGRAIRKKAGRGGR
jgi:hypothetical protein